MTSEQLFLVACEKVISLAVGHLAIAHNEASDDTILHFVFSSFGISMRDRVEVQVDGVELSWPCVENVITGEVESVSAEADILVIAIDGKRFSIKFTSRSSIHVSPFEPI